MRALISGRGKERKNTSGHSRQVFWSPTEKWVDQSGASCHKIMRNFHVSMYSSMCTYIMRGNCETISGLREYAPAG